MYNLFIEIRIDVKLLHFTIKAICLIYLYHSDYEYTNDAKMLKSDLILLLTSPNYNILFIQTRHNFKLSDIANFKIADPSKYNKYKTYIFFPPKTLQF